MATHATRAAPAAQGALPADVGHALRWLAAPRVPPASIETFAEHVAACYRASRATGREHGFLAYAPAAPHEPLFAESMSAGGRHEIRWHWQHPTSTVALSFHTHPGEHALVSPSGMDLVGALIRGDHLLYILAHDGRLAGWRFREPAGHPRAVEDALRALAQARKFGQPIVDFMYDAFEALRPRLVQAAYAARVEVTDDDGCRIARAAPLKGFFLPEERVPGMR